MKNLGGLLKRHHDNRDTADTCPLTAPPELAVPDSYFETRRASLPSEASVSRRAVPSLPRPQTFRRQESEKREKLLEVPSGPGERRTVSLDRRHGLSARAARRPLSPKPVPVPSVSAPEIVKSDHVPKLDAGHDDSNVDPPQPPSQLVELAPLDIPDLPNGDADIFDDEDDRQTDLSVIEDEYDSRWILNLSMHFRDRSNREKFFVTYAETPTKWRRLTISLDYRNAPEGSLEADLSTLHYQRDKSFQIYQAIRESLPEIQYYPTVTNLKLETTPSDGQLHVHVREDANEIIHYPSIDLFRHVRARPYRESDVEFQSHLSGFVYKVRAEGKLVIKKEIPGPDTIDEFLYEVNALDSLIGCRHVVQLEGLITDDQDTVVKGLLLSYASKGALVDILYDEIDTLEWHRREKWAKQIVEGLANIHEAGFVQGDFTLSNIVVDDRDNAVIIDINRRGCPMGWESPELARLINSGQRIGMCIGVKTDLFQLGMVLWGLAECCDEPERCEQPLAPLPDTTPTYYRRMVETCLCPRPQGRCSAKRLLRKFPLSAGRPSSRSSRRRPSTTVDVGDDIRLSDQSVSTHRSDKEYIDPDMAVTLEDVSSRRRRRSISPFVSEQVTYFDPNDPDSNPASLSYRFESSGSWVVGTRGRSPVSSRRRRSSPYAHVSSSSSATSLSGRSPPSRSRRRCQSESSDTQASRSRNRDRNDAGGDGEAGRQAISVPVIGHSTRDQELPQNRLLAGIQREDFQHHLALQHTDSGFDETMPELVEHEREAVSGVQKSGPPMTDEIREERFEPFINDQGQEVLAPAGTATTASARVPLEDTGSKDRDDMNSQPPHAPQVEGQEDLPNGLSAIDPASQPAPSLNALAPVAEETQHIAQVDDVPPPKLPSPPSNQGEDLEPHPLVFEPISNLEPQPSATDRPEAPAMAPMSSA